MAKQATLEELKAHLEAQTFEPIGHRRYVDKRWSDNGTLLFRHSFYGINTGLTYGLIDTFVGGDEKYRTCMVLEG